MKVTILIVMLLAVAYMPLRWGAGEALRRQLGPIVFVGAATIYFIGTVTPWAPLVLLVVFVIPFIQLGDRVDVACRYIMMMPLMPALNPALMAGGHMIGQFTPLDVFGFASLCASYFAGRKPGERRLTGFTPEDCMLVLLIVIFGVGALRFDDISALIRNVISYVLLLGVPFWIVRRAIRTRDELFLLMACLGASAVLIVAMALYERHSGWALFDGMAYRLTPSEFYARTAFIRGGALRSTATMSSPLELGVLMALSALALYTTRRFYRSSLIWGGSVVLVLLAMFAAQSRGALLATVVAGLVVLLVQRRYWLTFAALAAAAASYELLLLLARSSMRAAGLIGGQNYGDYRDYRTLLLERGLEEGRKHPVFGTSLKTVRENLTDITQGEHIIDFVNSYLHIFLISGLVGLGLCLIALLFVYGGLVRRANTRLSSVEERTRACCLAGLTAIVVSLFTMSFYGRGVLLLMFMLAATRVVRLTYHKRRRVPAAPKDETARREVAVAS